MVFWLVGKNCIVKNEDGIVFPESRYVNWNPVSGYTEIPNVLHYALF